jgi:hypothetical protein
LFIKNNIRQKPIAAFAFLMRYLVAYYGSR